jgi:uncharacterized membrane protein HdeD (DUF308 family)
VLGMITVIWRDVPLEDLTLMFFAYAMIDGVVNLGGAITAAESRERWGSLLMESMIGIAAALFVVAWPGLNLIYTIAAWGLATGALEIISAARLRKHVRREWLLSLSGAASIALGMAMIAVPLATSGIALWLGAYAFVFGALLVALVFRFPAQAVTHRERPATPAA